MSKDTKSSMDKVSFFEDRPMWLFLGWIIAALISTVFAMYFINVRYGLANEQIGSLGGAFQGTVGVAASIAGAVATIYLAKIAINLGREANTIAKSQERNEDPIYLKAREILSKRDELISCIYSLQYYIGSGTDYASRIIKGENKFHQDIKQGIISPNEYEIQDATATFSRLRKNIFTCYATDLNPQISKLIISLNPYILNIIASKPNIKVPNTSGTDWLENTYLLLKSIDSLSTNNGQSIPQDQLNDFFTSSDFIINILNWSEIGSLEEILKCLENETAYRIPNDVKEYVAKFTVAVENLGN